MAKNGVFKKITSLAMAIALVVCFAVSASADDFGVITTTRYVDDDIRVNVRVTGVPDGANVTYYATKSGADVHIDQVKADGTTAVFEFNVDGVEQLQSNVKIGYTGASDAEETVIDGYTVTLDNAQPQVIPTEATQVSFTYTATGSNKEFEKVTADSGVTGLGYSLDGSKINVTFTDISGDVNFTLVEKDKVATSEAKAEFISSGAVVSNGENDQILTGGHEDEKGNVIDGTLADGDEDVQAAEGARKLTVMGNVGEATVYGVIVSDTAITSEALSASAFAEAYSEKTYAGLTKSSNGLFAVQIIDTSTANPFIAAEGTYYTAVYARDSAGNYKVTAGAAPVVVPAAN